MFFVGLALGAFLGIVLFIVCQALVYVGSRDDDEDDYEEMFEYYNDEEDDDE